MLILSRNKFPGISIFDLRGVQSILDNCGRYIEYKNADELVFITNSSALLVRYLSAGCKRLWTCYSEYFIVSEEEGLQRK